MLLSSLRRFAAPCVLLRTVRGLLTGATTLPEARPSASWSENRHRREGAVPCLIHSASAAMARSSPGPAAHSRMTRALASPSQSPGGGVHVSPLRRQNSIMHTNPARRNSQLERRSIGPDDSSHQMSGRNQLRIRVLTSSAFQRAGRTATTMRRATPRSSALRGDPAETTAPGRNRAGDAGNTPAEPGRLAQDGATRSGSRRRARTLMNSAPNMKICATK